MFEKKPTRIMEHIASFFIFILIILAFFSSPVFALLGWTPLTITLLIIMLLCLLFCLWYYILYLKIKKLKKIVKEKGFWLFVILLILWLILITAAILNIQYL